MARSWSRRRVLAALAGLVAVAGALGARDFVARRRQARDAGVAPIGDDILVTVAELTGALFGHALSEQDRTEIVELLRYAVTMDHTRHTEYAFLAAFVDDEARASGAPSFLRASADQRDEIVTRVMTIDPSSLALRLLARASRHHLQQQELRSRTVPHLARIYRTSGVPWRVRGYTSWPGVPGDPTEYTRPA